MSFDIFSGEWNGPSCPCEEKGEWVSTCEAHPFDPTADYLRAMSEHAEAGHDAEDPDETREIDRQIGGRWEK